MPLLAMEAFQPYFNLIAGLSSIVGLIVSLWVLIRVGKLEKRFLFKARVPQIKNDLDGFMSELASLMRKYEEQEDKIRVLIGESKSVVSSLRGKADTNSWRQAKYVMKKIKHYYLHPSKDTSQSVYVEIRILIRTLEERLKDVEWES
jgi:hypothetical protein